MGAVSSCGLSPESLWETALAGKHGFSEIEAFELGDFPVRYAGEIKNWDPVTMGLNKKEARRMDRFTQFASAAANQAVADAGDFATDLDPFRVGVLMASGVGGFITFEEEHTKFMEKGHGKVSVFFIPMMLCNMASGRIAMDHGFKGENFCPVSACAASTNAIGEAFRKIKHGYLDACVAGGSEAAVTKFALAGFNNMGALASGDDPAQLSLPFDSRRSGFVMGEGGGALILEELGHAKRRGAKIYAEVVGYGITDDAYHITGPDPDGAGAARAMSTAIEEGGVLPEQVGYVNAHGTSTPLNDKIESLAIKTVFGERAYKLPVSSTKSVTGHMLGAAGAIEAIICAKALQDGKIPPTAGYKSPDPECDLDYVIEGQRKVEITHAISNSMGFGGHNASLAFAKFND
ncbi:MAG: beta-ketoacyl-ACP synthase II [Oscillospiraceae bacterium]|nr:beta-ketoacyl-ACP synthase II [Oscillospiraceae bacterium]